MNYPYSNLPLGTTSQDISQPEICAKCGQEIAPDQPHVLLADVPLIDALVCCDCAQDQPEPEGEPSNLQMCLVMGYWGMSTAWDWAKAKVGRV